MRSVVAIILFGVFLCTDEGCRGQASLGAEHLRLIQTIPMPGVHGRIDHLDINLQDGIVYIAALGNNTIEVADLNSVKTIHSITGVSEPQGVCYLSDQKEIFVANGGSGEGHFYNATTLTKLAALPIGDDADNVFYDAPRHEIYVGYSNGAIAIINAQTRQIISQIPVNGHPEGFAVDTTSQTIWVNVPDIRCVVMAKRDMPKTVHQWKLKAASANYPMAYDAVNRLLFVGCRRPARLLVINSITGEEITAVPCTGDADNVFYDAVSHRIIVSGGAGFVDLFEQSNHGLITPISHLASAKGARTCLWVPSERKLLLAVPEHGGKPAELRVYNMK